MAGMDPAIGSMVTVSTSAIARRMRRGTYIAPSSGASITTPPTRSTVHSTPRRVSAICTTVNMPDGLSQAGQGCW